MRICYTLAAVFIMASSAIAQNYCMYFGGAADGNYSNVSIPALNITSLPVTIEAWFKPDGVQNDYASIFFSRSGSATPTGIFLRPTYGNELRSIWANNNSTTSTGHIVANDAWHHVALVVTATAKLLYLDGVLFDYNTASNPLETFDTPSLIGWDDALPGRTFRGWIDEVRVWATARSPQQLNDNKFQMLAGNEQGLAAYWRFDDRAAQATDYSPNDFRGTLNGASYAASDLFEPMVVTGITAFQPAAEAMKNGKNQPVYRIAINTQHEADALSLQDLTINTNGTTRGGDIEKIRVFYSGSDPGLQTEVLFGELPHAMNTGQLTITGSQKLRAGLNYFWICYDISPTATDGHVLDAECSSLTIAGSTSSAVTPQPVAPAGFLSINNSLCVPHHRFAPDVVSSAAQTPVEGANFVSFQQNAITSYRGYQYVAYWNNAFHVCLARKKMPEGAWQIAEFTDYTVTAARVADNHYSISFGICPADGTIHISYDQHGDQLRYRRSVADLANQPDSYTWSSALFGNNRNALVGSTVVNPVTYPRFVTKPNGDLLFECRIGTSGGGDSYLWEYSGKTSSWTQLGKYVDGLSLDPDQNAYINGIHYDLQGRLHVSWVWRQTPDPLTNHDMYYTYSDDHGRTWKNHLGATVGSLNNNPLSLNTSGLKIFTIGQNRGLINQESQVVDSRGGIHILQSLMAESEPASTNFWQSRDKAFLYHAYKDMNGQWKNDMLPFTSKNRSQIAIDRHDNLYVVSPAYRVFFASAASQWQKWVEFDLGGQAEAINEGLIDREALLRDDLLSFVFATSDKRVIVPRYLLQNLDTGDGQGLRTTLFSSSSFTMPAFQFLDSINFSWDTNTLLPGITADTFSLQAEGKIKTQYAEQYTLHVGSNSASRVWIDGRLVADIQAPTGFTVEDITLPLVASHWHTISIQSRVQSLPANTTLEWSSPSQARTTIPRSQLYGDSIEINRLDTLAIQLQQGWNLMSINLMPGAKITQGRDSVNRIATLFAGLNVHEIKTMDAFWRIDNQGEYNSLTSIVPGKGYLAKMNKAGTLMVVGTPIEVTPNLGVSTGWQLIGCPFKTTTPFSTYFNTTNCKVIKNFDGFWIPHGSSNSIQEMQPGKAYFVK